MWVICCWCVNILGLSSLHSSCPGFGQCHFCLCAKVLVTELSQYLASGSQLLGSHFSLCLCSNSLYLIAINLVVPSNWAFYLTRSYLPCLYAETDAQTLRPSMGMLSHMAELTACDRLSSHMGNHLRLWILSSYFRHFPHWILFTANQGSGIISWVTSMSEDDFILTLLDLLLPALALECILCIMLTWILTSCTRLASYINLYSLPWSTYRACRTHPHSSGVVSRHLFLLPCHK